MFLILLGLFVLLLRNNFDVQGVAKDIRRIARFVRKAARELGRTVRDAVKDAKKETAEARTAKAVSEQRSTVSETPVAEPAQAETPQSNELLKELEQNARAAAMLASVPTIAFPEDDPKYDSSRKYMYA